MFLYVGMAMMVGAFICFMLLGRDTYGYLVVNTLLLESFGIFDLFWWSILGEMLDYAVNPVRVFGIGLSANVLGVLCGGILGANLTSMGLSGAEFAVVALVVVCVTLALLPPLNSQLVALLKKHVYLAADDRTKRIETRVPLTTREEAILSLILVGKSNSAIAEALSISENTVKTHVRGIFTKYNVANRIELISTLLQKPGEN